MRLGLQTPKQKNNTATMENSENGGVEPKQKNKGKHRKPKPWDDDPNIDRWKIEKFDPSWNEGGMLEVTSFSTLFPQYRGANSLLLVPLPSFCVWLLRNCGKTNFNFFYFLSFSHEKQCLRFWVMFDRMHLRCLNCVHCLVQRNICKKPGL